MAALSSLFPAHQRQRLFWQLQALGWSGTLLLSMGLTSQWPSQHLIGLAIARSLFGLIVTTVLLRPLCRSIYRKRGIRQAPSANIIATLRIIATCALLGALDTATITWMIQWLEGGASPGRGVQASILQFLGISIVLRWIVYSSWCGLYFGVHYWLDTQQDQLRIAQTETALRASELQLLRSQVNPHFLFNALNSILAASKRPEAVQHLTLALADYLRFSLEQRSEANPLGEELDALENYLAVEKVRFGSDLEYSIQADEEARNWLAPVALVQPLLENAIKYGQQSCIRPLNLQINCKVVGALLHVHVINSGRWFSPERNASTGIGLSNLQRRLKLIFNDQASLNIATPDNRVRVEVRLPPFPLS